MENSPWLLTMSSVIAPTAIAIWTLIQWMANRKDKAREREESEELKRENEMDRERKELIENRAMIFAQIKTELEFCKKDIESKNRELIAIWERARFWHQKAWDMRNEAAYARQIVESGRRLAGEPFKGWDVPLDMPAFDSADSKIKVENRN